MAKSAKKPAAKVGRPSSFRTEFIEQAAKLCDLGATDLELADFFAADPSEDDWFRVCLALIREDRRGVFAAQKRSRAAARKASMAASPSRRIRNAVAARMWAALKGKSDGALFSRLGYSEHDLVAHLEGQFRDGMSWETYGKWHVDHVKPCASFDLADPEQFSRCWALSNLAPLWAAENITKGAKYGAS